MNERVNRCHSEKDQKSKVSTLVEGIHFKRGIPFRLLKVSYFGGMEGILVRTRIIVLKLVLIGVILCCPRSDGFRNAGGARLRWKRRLR